MANNALSPLIVAFVAALVFLVLVSEVADSTVDITEIKTSSNETLTGLAKNVPYELTFDQLEAVSRVANATGAFKSSNYTVDLQQGVLTWTGQNLKGTFQTTYTYRKVGDDTSRALLSLTPLLFVLGGFLLVLAALNPAFRESIGNIFGKN